MNEEIIKSLNKKLDKAIDKGRNLLNEQELQKALGEAKDKTDDLIKKYPIESVFIGLVAGFVLAKMLRSKD